MIMLVTVAISPSFLSPFSPRSENGCNNMDLKLFPWPPLHPTPSDTHTVVLSGCTVFKCTQAVFSLHFVWMLWKLLWCHTVLNVCTASLDEYTFYVIQNLRTLSVFESQIFLIMFLEF